METRLLKTKETAALLGVSVMTLSNWRKKGIGPRFFRFSHKIIRYDIEEIEKWKQSQFTNGQPRLESEN